MSKFGLPCAFFCKSESYRFSTRKIYAESGKRCLQLFCSVNVTVTSQNGVPSFTCIKELTCVGVINTTKIVLFLCLLH